VNHGAVDYSTRTLSHWVTRYLQTGQVPPPAPRIKTDAGGNIVRDAKGLAEGDPRHVFVQVPVSYNAAMGCPLFGTNNQWTAAKIRSIYPSHAIYLSNVSAWSTYEVQKGVVATGGPCRRPSQCSCLHRTVDEREHRATSGALKPGEWARGLRPVGRVPVGR
jgi:hypothetical protein